MESSVRLESSERHPTVEAAKSPHKSIRGGAERMGIVGTLGTGEHIPRAQGDVGSEGAEAGGSCGSVELAGGSIGGVWGTVCRAEPWRASQGCVQPARASDDKVASITASPKKAAAHRTTCLRQLVRVMALECLRSA